jgi:hypothetical protein
VPRGEAIDWAAVPDAAAAKARTTAPLSYPFALLSHRRQDPELLHKPNQVGLAPPLCYLAALYAKDLNSGHRYGLACEKRLNSSLAFGQLEQFEMEVALNSAA